MILIASVFIALLFVLTIVLDTRLSAIANAVDALMIEVRRFAKGKP